MLAKKPLFEMAIFDIVMMVNTIGIKILLNVKETVVSKIWQNHEF